MTELSLDLSDVTLPTHDGGTLTFADYSGRRAVLVLGNQRNADQVPGIADRLHGAVETADVPIIQVAHLKGVPRVFRRLAERDVKRGMNEQLEALRTARAARGLPAEDAEGLLTMGLDWSGEVTTGAGFTANDETPAAFLVDEQCRVVAAASGADLVSTVQSFLRPAADS